MNQIKNRLPFLFFFLFANLAFAQKYTISGHVKDAANGEEMIAATVSVKGQMMGMVTNGYGFYSLTLDKGEYTIQYRYVGYDDVEKKVVLNKNMTIDIELAESAKEMKAAVVSAKKMEQQVENKKISVVKMDIETIKAIPVLFGEVDIMKTITFMPGIQSAGEGNSGINVRGGGQDQNLILLDEAPVYNASHLLGFFSVFNGDAVKDLEVYKGGIPAKYGGRLSSLIDVRMKDGNKKRMAATGGIGLISSRLTVEGPIKKDVASFMVAGRRSYADLFLPLAPNKDLQENKLYFYDLNAKANYSLGKNDR
ncbi:MAG: carboxypeptidase-like regulatory domain-containing protein [Bacteroidia bacterium]|nr:carboxypeptidase-like regulatory domain-containing protein [Bacteroidia bacterium]